MEDYTSWRRTTAGGIKYKHVSGPDFTADDLDSITASERYIIRAQDVGAFYDESLPPPVVTLGVATLPLRRKLPGSSQLYTKRLKFTPMGGDRPADPLGADSSAPSGTYDQYYYVDITYETSKASAVQPDYGNPETFLERSVDVGVEILSINPRKTQVADGTAGATPAGARATQDMLMPITKSIPTIELTLRWSYVLSPNWPLIVSLLGHVNSTARSLFLNSEADTVLFNGVSGSQTYLWDTASATYGVQPWKLDFSFSIRRVAEGGNVYGWNHVWSPHEGGWKFLLRNGQTLYPRSDLQLLFS